MCIHLSEHVYNGYIRTCMHVFRNLKELVHGQMASQMGASIVHLSGCIDFHMELLHIIL